MTRVSRQVYYRSLRSTKKRRQRAFRVVELVKEVRKQMPMIGTRKLYHLLYSHLRELGVGRDQLFRIMKANHLDIKPKRQYHITTNSHHRFRKHKNLVEHLELNRPEQLWVADITHIGSRLNPMYLALVTDAYSKMIVGYDVSNSLDVSGSVRALKMAIRKRKYKQEELVHHSDRGLQYCGNDYQKLLNKNGIKCSMTESYDPYQNSVAERINGILKQEFIRNSKPSKIETMNLLVKNSIEIYNKKRPHYSCYMMTPEKMHNQNSIKIRTYKTKNSSKNVFAAV
ncbi:MAG: IS3 family transposase [Chitinophagales bacterium]